MTKTLKPETLKQRLLLDIAELQRDPYPKINLHIQGNDLTRACLVLDTDRYGSIHLTVELSSSFPLSPPRIKMNSNVSHPNVFGSYICASILNTTEGYTPAYTLKGIAIQLLSFFDSDNIEQVDGGYSIEINSYASLYERPITRITYICKLCGHGQAQPTKYLGSITTKKVSKKLKGIKLNQARLTVKGIQSMMLPDEVLLLICDNLENQDLWRFAQAWTKIGKIITAYDVIHTRELLCFCLKKDYKEAKLGVGISVTQRSKIGRLESEFDLLSQAGFYTHSIRRSVQGIPFEHWLPLPISHKHWRDVKTITIAKLTSLALAANFGNIGPAQVVYKFMNDIVIKLNNQATDPTAIPRYGDSSKSTLTHASEKAIDSYFHLFHLLLCLAVDDPSIVRDADRDLRNFANGRTSKKDVPDLGHLVVASLISSVDMNEAMLKSMVKEAIARNVVWMLKTSP